MKRRTIAAPVLMATVAATFLVVSPAQAENCVALPGTTGATIEAGGQTVRVPLTSGVAVCVEGGGLVGLPRVETAGSTVSVVLGAGSSTSGYVSVRYALDGDAREIRVPIPGGGGPETCLASVGDPARYDCLVKVSLDEVPPIPTAEPLPTAPPVPTVRPLPDRICSSPPGCVPSPIADPVAFVNWVCYRVSGDGCLQ